MTYVDIYFDTQDPNNEGWAYRRFQRDEMGHMQDEQSGEIYDLDDLAAVLKGATLSEHSECQADDLPTFGGEEPDDPAEVLSWDETRLLVQAANSEPTLIPRNG